MNFSIWNKNNKAKYPTINKNEEFDVLIVGGGITGASVAFYLKDSGLKIGLVEANNIGCGVTANSTAKLTLLQEKIPLNIDGLVSKKAAKLYLKAQKEGLKNTLEIINTYQIDCDLVQNRGFIYCKDEKNKKSLAELEEMFLEQGLVIKHDDIPIDIGACGSFSLEDTYVFNPVKYLRKLVEIANSSGVFIYEKSRFYDYDYQDEKYTCQINDFSVKTNHLVFCCHYLPFILPYLMPFRVRQERSQMNIYKVDEDLRINAINIDKSIHSIRYYCEDNQIYKIVLSDSRDNALFRKKEKERMVSNIDVITQDYLPLIGHVGKNMLLATGYNTWGMESANIAGTMINDFIVNKENEYSNLFNPKRFFRKSSLINLPMCLYVNSYAFINSYLFKDKAYFRKGMGIYIDKEGNTHKVRAICPHAKCHLIFNKTDKTWDCPCHGSRFSLDGDIILGPANYSIRIK